MSNVCGPLYVTVKRIPDAEQSDVLARQLGLYGCGLEHRMPAYLKCLSRDYVEAHWHVFELSNGGFYMAPDLNYNLRVEDPEVLLTPDAAGICATLLAINEYWRRTSAWDLGVKFEELWWYACLHPEKAAICRACGCPTSPRQQSFVRPYQSF